MKAIITKSVEVEIADVTGYGFETEQEFVDAMDSHDWELTASVVQDYSAEFTHGYGEWDVDPVWPDS